MRFAGKDLTTSETGLPLAVISLLSTETALFL